MLLLDAARISGFREEIRRLAVGAALYTLANCILNNAGVVLNQRDSTGLQIELLRALDAARNSRELAVAAAEVLRSAAGNKQSKLPAQHQLLPALKSATSRRQPGNLRTLFTRRIGAAVVSAGEEAEKSIH